MLSNFFQLELFRRTSVTLLTYPELPYLWLQPQGPKIAPTNLRLHREIQHQITGSLASNYPASGAHKLVSADVI
jgi:hypothetical protein